MREQSSLASSLTTKTSCEDEKENVTLSDGGRSNLTALLIRKQFKYSPAKNTSMISVCDWSPSLKTVPLAREKKTELDKIVAPQLVFSLFVFLTTPKRSGVSWLWFFFI